MGGLPAPRMRTGGHHPGRLLCLRLLLEGFSVRMLWWSLRMLCWSLRMHCWSPRMLCWSLVLRAGGTQAVAEGEDGGGGISACAWVIQAPLHPLLMAAQASVLLDQHLRAGCITQDWLRWCDMHEHCGSDMATCPYSSQWPLCATFNCFCAVSGEPSCPGFTAPAGTSSSSLLFVLTACWALASPSSSQDDLKGP